MPQIKFSLHGKEFSDNPQTLKSFQTIQDGLKYGEWTPTLTNVNTPDASRYTYQVCGKVCHFSIYMQYVGTFPIWTAPPSVSLPFQADVSPSGTGQHSFVYPVYDWLAVGLVGYGSQNTATVNKIILPVYSPGASKEIIISGFFWIKN